MADVTQILGQIASGDKLAAEQLLPLVYDELRQLAAQRMLHEAPGQTLQATALVHEAYLRLIDDQAFANRGHFFAAAAEAMRRILIENARRKGRLKRGGAAERQAVDLEALAAELPDDDVLALHEALERLAVHDATKARLVELRYFGGLTLAEAAECLEMSLSSADRAWRYARAWLYTEMADDRKKSADG
jgi:RNA polymerase sigma factor (TIGR02999 family)